MSDRLRQDVADALANIEDERVRELLRATLERLITRIERLSQRMDELEADDE